MDITETSTITIIGADWNFVRTAVTDPHGLFAPGFARAPYANDEIPDNGILMASDPGFGAERCHTLLQGEVAEYIGGDDDSGAGDGWWVLTEDNLAIATWVSGSSGSEIRVALNAAANTWTVTGTFPIRDGKRYEGLYFEAIQAAIAGTRKTSAA